MHAIGAGKDVSFGKGKEGNADFLKANAAKYGYSVDLIDKILADECDKGELLKGQVVSSTLLRRLLTEGDMLRVSELLGKPYTLSGPVIHGKGIGKSEMQYPTMNIEVSDELILPPYGVYAVKAYIYDDRLSTKKQEAEPTEVRGIANLGERPTVHGSVEGGARLRLEVHSFDQIGDVYGDRVSVELLKFIRAERKFDSIKELAAQITEHDVPEAKAFLGMLQ